MAIEPFTVFFPYSGGTLNAETDSIFKSPTADPFPNASTPLTSKSFFPITHWSNDVEQTLNIGSQSSGAGAGKITFNPFSITRKVDVISETLFLMCASGTAFQYLDLILHRPTSGKIPGTTLVAYRFGLVALKTIAWASQDAAPLETVTFEYGSLSIAYATQNADGSHGKFAIAGWDRVKNVKISYPASTPRS